MFFYQNEGPRLVLMGGRPHAEKWALLGKWLDENADPGDVVATPVVGAIGYYCHATIVDMLGIVDETIAHTPVADPGAGPKDHNRFNTEYVLGRKPDYIYLLHSRPTEEVFLEKPSWLPALEDLKRYFPREDYEFKAITIDHCRFCLYVRRD
jgi:hypothetical protein